MFVLHSSYLPSLPNSLVDRSADPSPQAMVGEQWVLWAENTSPHSDTLSASDYPYQAATKELLEVMLQLGFKGCQNWQSETLWLWSPAHQGHFWHSEMPLTDGLSLAPRNLKVLLCPFGDLLSQLQLVVEQNYLAYGPEFEVLFQLKRLAESMLERLQIIPDLQQLGSQWRSLWRPLLDAQDQMDLAQLAQYLPESARALTPFESEPPPQLNAYSILQKSLEQMIDTLVRQQAIGPEPGYWDQHDTPENWLNSLRIQNPKLRGEDKDFRRLQQSLEAWSGLSKRLAAAPLQMVLQIEEPNENSDAWYLRLLLRPLADPSMYLPLEYVWTSIDQQPEVLAQIRSLAQEFVQDAQHLLAQHFAPAQALLEVAQAVGMELDLEQVKDFLGLSEHLEAQGFGLRLPSWWLKGRQKLTGNVRFTPPAFQAGGSMSVNTLLQADWQVMLGDQEIGLEELKQLAQFKSELVQWNGQWLMVEPDTLKRARRFFAKQNEGQMRLGDVMALGPDAESAPFEVIACERSDWLQDFLNNLQEGTPPEIPVPEKFIGSLRPYQLRGLNWLAFLCGHGLGACLADDMGLGKTIQTLALVQHLREKHPAQAERLLPVLLVCPTSLLSNWMWEAEHFTPHLKVKIHHGSQRLKAEAFENWRYNLDIVITSYALLARDKELLTTLAWSGVILDEAQNIKNPETQQSKVACALQSHWRIALTGTPVENHVGDLWSIMNFLHPGLLGSSQSFQESYLTPIQRWQDKDALRRLKRLVSPFILRRLKSDRSIVADLPDKFEMKVHCALSREQASLYMAVVQELEATLERVSGMARRGLILATLTRLKQICNHPAQYLGERTHLTGRSGKLTRLKEMLLEIQDMNEKSLVFTQYAEMAEILQIYLREHLQRDVLLLHGGTPAPERARLIQRFQNETDNGVFVLSLKAGGTGLNLTAANHVFHYDRWWNPAVENQATDRAYRIGQDKQVQVHAFVCRGTLEERIDQILTQKRAVADQIVGSGEHWLTEMSNDELHELFALDMSDWAAA